MNVRWLTSFVALAALSVSPIAVRAAAPAAPPATADQDAAESASSLSALEAAVKQHPSDAVALARLGAAQVRSGADQEAGFTALTRATTLAPAEPEVMLLYAKALWKAGRAPEALERALRAAQSPLATNKIAGEALFVAGSIKWRQREMVEAEALLKRAVERDGKNVGALMNLGMLYLDTERTGEGLGALETARLRSPDDAKLLKTLARIHEARGETDKAAPLWAHVAELLPADPNIAFIHGNYLFAKRRWEAARVQFAKAVALNPADGNARYRLAETLLRQGQYAAAEENAALALKMSVPNAQELLDAIAFERKGNTPLQPDADAPPVVAPPTPPAGDNGR